jgi:type I restriction enzyme R subunit
MANDLSELSKSLDISGSSSNFVQAMSSSYSDSSLKQQIQTKEHKVICSTIQKFPYIKEVLKILTNKKFAIILDEAHSSTEGEYLRSVKLVKDLANEGKNISIFAFTATPKQSTLELFGSFNEQKNIKQPFYLYSHKQAISEEMIIDVLNNEIKTVKRSEKLNEPEIDKIFEDRTQAAIKLREEINNRDDILRKECEYDLDLFFEKVEPLLNHTAKAMFISSSRKNAQKRAYILNQILAERGKNIKVLAGFSGILDKEELEEEEIERINTNEQEDEIKLSKQLTNDERIKDIGETFKYGIKLGNNKYDNSFRILVCANKFQTGFDVPSLCGLFVHRKMTSSVNAFQTYNRLNRNYSFKTDDGIIYKKEKTFILD